jgi:hypothetical protein
MSTSKYISNTKVIDHNQQIVFDYLSNFENLGTYLNSGLLENIAQKFPQVTISEFKSDRDSCQFHISNYGFAEIYIVDREPHKTIKVKSQGGLPVDLTLWIQLMPAGAFQTKMRLTLHAHMNMMVKMVVGDRLEDGVNQLAQTLSELPYQ